MQNKSRAEVGSKDGVLEYKQTDMTDRIKLRPTFPANAVDNQCLKEKRRCEDS